MKISTPNRIRAEDFKEELREVAEKLAGINDFQDEVVNLVNNGRIDFENLNRQKAQFDVNTDSSGLIISKPQIKLDLNTKPYGLNIVRIININDPGTLPTHLPLIDFSFNDTILTINVIKGLTASAKYRIYLEIIGT
jgi:hypothetical protein